MQLKDLGEFGFINRVGPQCLIRKDRVYKGIGDDAAAFWSDGRKLTLVTTDMLVERIHFVRQGMSGFDLGYKALAVNLSDIAAMGGTAREAFVSLAVPEDCALTYLDELYQGMQHLAREFEVNILGGDTTGSKQDLILNLVVTGEVAPDQILCRDRARPGDILCCTGFLGDSRAGLNLMMNDITQRSAELDKLVQAHVRPWPHLRGGRFLAGRGEVTAAIDVSDGLSSDLAHLSTASGIGARVEAEKLPISTELKAFCAQYGFDPISWALAGGEDYCLLFTVQAQHVSTLVREYARVFGLEPAVIGEMTATQTLELVDASGHSRPLQPTGWNHFSPQEGYAHPR